MAKKEGALFEYGSGSEYINSVLSGERLSNNLKALARTIAGRKIKQMKSQDKDITTAKAKRAVKDAIAEAKAKQKPKAGMAPSKPKTQSKPMAPSKPKTTTTKSTNPGRPGGESKERTSREPRTIAEAKRMGKSYFIGKDGKRKAAVTAEELKKSGHKNLTAYLNAKGKPAKKDKSKS